MGLPFREQQSFDGAFPKTGQDAAGNVKIDANKNAEAKKIGKTRALQKNAHMRRRGEDKTEGFFWCSHGFHTGALN